MDQEVYPRSVYDTYDMTVYSKKRAYLSLGSNMGNRQQILSESICLLNQLVGEITAQSSFYETEPWGFDSVHPFLNAAIAIKTDLTPQNLLKVTQLIEQRLGRISKSKNSQYSDRPIDIDILLYDRVVLSTPELTLPHPFMHERMFVLTPLAEIAPEATHPLLGQTIAELYQAHLRFIG